MAGVFTEHSTDICVSSLASEPAGEALTSKPYLFELRGYVVMATSVRVISRPPSRIGSFQEMQVEGRIIMTTIVQLNPPITLYVPHLDDFGVAWFLIDYHMEENLYWVCAMEKTGKIWTIDNTKVRACKNPSLGRTLESSTASENDLTSTSAGQRAGETPPSL